MVGGTATQRLLVFPDWDLLSVVTPDLRTPIDVAVITLKFKFKRPNHGVICPKDANEMTNSEDPDQAAPRRQTGLYLHCLPIIICQKT